MYLRLNYANIYVALKRNVLKYNVIPLGPSELTSGLLSILAKTIQNT